MSKILMIIAPNFRDPEYFVPKDILEKAGHTITTASKETGEITGNEGGKTQAEIRAQDADVTQFDGVVFVGGPGMVDLVGDLDFISLAQKFFNADKLTAAICVAPAILANAGLLQGKKVTGWEGIGQTITQKGGQYSGQKVEVDGKIITASGPEAAAEFGNKLVEVLKRRSFGSSVLDS